MSKLSSHGKKAIDKAVDDLFDSIALQLVGEIPKLKGKKLLIFSTKQKYSLANLFVQSMANKVPNSIESEFMRGLLESAYSYIETLKDRTKANILDRIIELKKRGSSTEKDIQDVLDEEMERARYQIKAIAEAESTKIRNLGTAMDITRQAASISDEDPSIYFAVVKDATTCKECIRLHLKDDGFTPKVWKFSQLKHSYHKRGEDSPSAFGLHPHCRCTLVYLSKGFGFDKDGHLKYKGVDYDEYES